MNTITRKEFEEKLEVLSNKKVIIQSDGYVKCKIVIEKCEFKIANDILLLKSQGTESYFEFNLNTINYMEYHNKTLICVLDDNMETKITIK